jgi:hypothetical protein
VAFRVTLHRWPVVDLYKPAGPGVIKSLSTVELERLMQEAAGRWSATGRPQWFRSEQNKILHVMMVITGVEHPSVYRCMVTVMLNDRTAQGVYTRRILQ